jgi:glyoxylase-like metal-dependent hydrolase (beta-lactamase superfamily II)
MKVQKVGNVEIHKVSEIDKMAMDANWLFPSIDRELVAGQRSWLGPDFIEPVELKLYLSFHSYVIKTRHHTILVDTCNGNHKQRPSMPAWTNLQLPYLENLAAIGVKPEDVDFVMCTHLHTDHVGWNTRLENGRWVPTFPRARYLMGRVEYEHFHQLHQSNPSTPVNRGSFVDSVLPVVESGQAVFVEMDHVMEHEVGQDVWLSPACGHTPGHVFVHVGQEARDHTVLTGDVIHHPVQFSDPHLSNLADFDAQQAYETRVGLMRRYADTSTKVLTGHFPSPTAGRIVSHGDEFRFAFESA